MSTSDTGIEYSTPSSPKSSGSSSAKPTPNRTSRTIESMVDRKALPSDCRYMKVALFTVASIIMHR